MNHNTMEIVEEGALESISRPNSSSTRCSIDVNSRPSTEESSFLLERLPSEDIDNVDDFGDLAIEDVIDSGEEEEEEREARQQYMESKELTNFVLQEGAQDNEESKGGRNEEKIDPKVTKGLKKIKQLDALLEEAGKKEKEAKDERRKMEHELRVQLRELLEQRNGMQQRVGQGVQQLLALCSIDDGKDSSPMSLTYDGSETDSVRQEFSPVFQTQVEVNEDQDRSARPLFSKRDSQKSIDSETGESERQGNKESKRNSARSSRSKGTASKEHKSKKKSKRNFIERNIKLAAHAGEIIALTSEEQKRLDELLSDESDLFSTNPFSSASMLTDSSGFHHDQEAAATLMLIDEKLKDLIPDEEYSSICFTPRSETESACGNVSERSYSTKGDISSNQCAVTEDIAIDGESIQLSDFRDEGDSELAKTEQSCGESILRDTRHFREMHLRLNAIEKQLSKFQITDSDEGDLTGSISQDLLRQLLDVNSRATSTALSIMDVVSGRLSVSDNSVSDNVSVVSKSELNLEVQELEGF